LKCPCGEVFDMHGPEAVLTHGLTSRRPKLYVDTFKSEATGHWGTAPRWALGKYGTTGATGQEGTATRTINRDFSRSFLRHFNNASVASSQPHLWDDCLPASGAL